MIEVFKNYYTTLSTSDIISQWDCESSLLFTYLQKTCQYIDTQKQKFSNCQKVKQSLMNKKKEGSYYAPNIPQEFWQHGIFLLGSYSTMAYTSNIEIRIKIHHNKDYDPDEHGSDWDLDDSLELSSDSSDGEGAKSSENFGESMVDTDGEIVGDTDGEIVGEIVGEICGEDSATL